MAQANILTQETKPEGFIGPVLPGQPSGSNQIIGPPVPSGTPASGGGGTSTQSLNVGSGVFQPAPTRVSDEQIDATFSPALEALGGLESALTGALPGQISALEGQAEATRRGLLSEQERRLGEFGAQRGREERRTESAINAARRQFAELQQGLQSRFGGTTGTGAFAAELAGRQTLQNIGSNRAALTDTLGQIGRAENALRTDIGNRIFELDQNLAASKQRLQDNLREQIARINLQRGELESSKAESKLNALREFQQLSSQIDAQNARLKLQLQQDFQAQQNQLASLAQREQQQFAANQQLLDFANFITAGGQGQQPGVAGTTTASNLRSVPGQQGVPSLEDILSGRIQF